MTTSVTTSVTKGLITYMMDRHETVKPRHARTHAATFLNPNILSSFNSPSWVIAKTRNCDHLQKPDIELPRARAINKFQIRRANLSHLTSSRVKPLRNPKKRLLRDANDERLKSCSHPSDLNGTDLSYPILYRKAELSLLTLTSHNSKLCSTESTMKFGGMMERIPSNVILLS